jgi:hypothetical protein
VCGSFASEEHGCQDLSIGVRQPIVLTSPLKTCLLAENNTIKALQSSVASAEADSCLRLNIRPFKIFSILGIRFEILFYNLKFLF